MTTAILGIKPDVIHSDSFSRSASYGVLPPLPTRSPSTETASRRSLGRTLWVLLVAQATNVEEDVADFTGDTAKLPSHDTASIGEEVFAVWSPVPELGTGILMGLGLIALSVRNRRET